MSEEDRAAKAARAKALLKKRQQKKAADSAAAVASSGSGSPVAPSRTLSPALPEPAQEDKRDLGDVFSTDTSDTSWLTSLPMVTSPPAPISTHTSPPVRRVSTASSQAVAVSSDYPPASSTSTPADSNVMQSKIYLLSKENETLAATVAQLRQIEAAAQETQTLLESERKLVQELNDKYTKLQSDTKIALANEQQTVSLLVAEKAHLTSELQKREEYEAKTLALEENLEAEQTKSQDLTDQVSKLQAQVLDVSQRAKQLDAKEKELLERCKDQERQLHIVTAAGAESRKEADDAQRKLRELEDQIQNDDRVDRLETSLKNTQDRADELEFQLSKFKQSYASLKSEKELLDSKVKENSTKESEWNLQRSGFETQIGQAREELASVKVERDLISAENAKLQGLSETHSNSVKSLEERLAQATSALAANAKQTQTMQQELKNAIRRADDAENTQKSLQAEGSRLMEAVDEMRPKIVELTSVKLELSEKVENLEHTLRNRDSLISQLENDLGEAREHNEQNQDILTKRLEEHEKQHKNVQNDVTDLQKAYTELQEELDSALASLRNLETQRANQHQEASRRLEEIERMTVLLQTQGEEVDALRHELEARNEAHEEEQDFLERAQNEVESLRAEINARDNEIEHLRETAKSPVTQSDIPKSLDDELLGTIRQQHAMEISAATSQIRALENTIFDKDSVNHSLQKQINKLEEQLAHLRSNSRLGPPSRPASRTWENDARRSSLHSHRGNQPPPLSRTIFDHAMTPETRHKRKVSLSMLKARIESEAKPISQPTSRALSPVHSEGHSRPSSVASVPHIHRPQFLDESHVFWCNSCHGDLVIL